MLGAQQLPLSTKIKTSAANLGHPIEVVPVKIKQSAPANLADLNISINEDQVIPDHRPSLLIHTTGTASPPKSVIYKRRLFNRKFSPTPNDRILVYESLDWISANITLLVRIVTATQGDILPTYPGPAVIWERLRTDVAGIIAPHTATTKIRVLRDGETVPRTFNRKIWRRKAIVPFFPEVK